MVAKAPMDVKQKAAFFNPGLVAIPCQCRHKTGSLAFGIGEGAEATIDETVGELRERRYMALSREWRMRPSHVLK